MRNVASGTERASDEIQHNKMFGGVSLFVKYNPLCYSYALFNTNGQAGDLICLFYLSKHMEQYFRRQRILKTILFGLCLISPSLLFDSDVVLMRHFINCVLVIREENISGWHFKSLFV